MDDDDIRSYMGLEQTGSSASQMTVYMGIFCVAFVMGVSLVCTWKSHEDRNQDIELTNPV